MSVLASGSVEAVDFAAVEAFDIEIAAGASSGTGSFTLAPIDDAKDEIDEAITVRVERSDGEPGHDHVDRRRRGAVAVDQLAERY